MDLLAILLSLYLFCDHLMICFFLPSSPKYRDRSEPLSRLVSDETSEIKVSEIRNNYSISLFCVSQYFVARILKFKN
jgi:hypothetical protein